MKTNFIFNDFKKMNEPVDPIDQKTFTINFIKLSITPLIIITICLLTSFISLKGHYFLELLFLNTLLCLILLIYILVYAQKKFLKIIKGRLLSIDSTFNFDSFSKHLALGSLLALPIFSTLLFFECIFNKNNPNKFILYLLRSKIRSLTVMVISFGLIISVFFQNNVTAKIRPYIIWTSGPTFHTILRGIDDLHNINNMDLTSKDLSDSENEIQKYCSSSGIGNILSHAKYLKLLTAHRKSGSIEKITSLEKLINFGINCRSSIFETSFNPIWAFNHVYITEYALINPAYAYFNLKIALKLSKKTSKRLDEILSDNNLSESDRHKIQALQSKWDNSDNYKNAKRLAENKILSLLF